MRKIKSIYTKAGNLASGRHRPLLSNFMSLGITQGANFLLSVFTFPYLVRVLGVERFGLIVLLQTVMLYFTVLTDYGFNLTATQDVSVNRKDKRAVSDTFSEVLSAKVFLLAVSLLLLLTLLWLIPAFQDYRMIALLSFPIVVGQVLQPAWFFQGIEQMKYITYINILVRGLYAISVFTFIHGPDDYLLVNLLNGLSLIIGGIVSLALVFRQFSISFRLPAMGHVKAQLVKSWSIFFSTLTVFIANNSNLLILGLFASPLVLGYYSIAEKTFQITRTFAVILHQVVYPRVCLLAQESVDELKLFLKNITKLILATFVPLSLLVFVLADFIVLLISGKPLPEAALVLRIVSFGPTMAALNIPAAQTMLAYHFTKSYTLVVGIGAVVNVALNFVLAYYFQATGTAISIMVTEALITFLLYARLHRSHPAFSFFTPSRTSVQAPA
ncbi:flippase [Pontibacter sp. CAU 1760]